MSLPRAPRTSLPLLLAVLVPAASCALEPELEEANYQSCWIPAATSQQMHVTAGCFSRNAVAGGDNGHWWQEPDGAWYTFANGSVRENFGRWDMVFEKRGVYRLSAWVAHGDNRTNAARYEITTADGNVSIMRPHRGFLDQDVQWIPLGTYAFEANVGYNVTVADDTGEPLSDHRRITFSSLMVEPVSDSMTVDCQSYIEDLGACNAVPKAATASATGCSWYACKEVCLPAGTNQDLVCSGNYGNCPSVNKYDTIIDESSACFVKSGTPQYWWNRDGYAGTSVFTYGLATGPIDNVGRWNLNFDYDGTYGIYAHIPAVSPRSQATTYRIRHGGAESTVGVNQQAVADNSFVYLGQFWFNSAANDANQWVEIADVTGEAEMRPVLFDALRIMGSGD